MARFPPDGYTIGLTISNIIYAHTLYQKLPFDIQKDFEPVSMISRSAVALAVAANFPANTLEEFVALVKKTPGKYSYASFGQGTSAIIFGESLNLAAKLDLVHVPYKGAAPMVTDLLGGQVSSAILDTASLRPHMQSGKMKVLADQGADVIKVESAAGDLTRKIGPVKGDMTGLFAAVNRGKRSIVLDPRQPEGLAALRQLIARADVLVENFRPGVMERLGLGWDTLHARHPRLVMLSITGFGASGPCAGQRVYDTVIQAVSGMADAHPDEQTGEPRLLRTLMCDKVTALTAAQAVTAALLARAGDGRGRLVEVNMLDAAVAFLWPEAFYNHAFLDEPPAPVPEYGSTLALWRASDGCFSLVTPQGEEFAAMCRAFGHPEWTQDSRLATIPLRRRHYQLVREWAEPIVATKPVAHWLARLAAEGAPAGRVNTKAEPPDDPQVRHNRTLEDVDHGALLGRIRMPRAAATFDAQANNAAPLPSTAPLRPAPRLGEHTQALLRELGGLPKHRRHP